MLKNTVHNSRLPATRDIPLRIQRVPRNRVRSASLRGIRTTVSNPDWYYGNAHSPTVACNGSQHPTSPVKVVTSGCDLFVHVRIYDVHIVPRHSKAFQAAVNTKNALLTDSVISALTWARQRAQGSPECLTTNYLLNSVREHTVHLVNSKLFPSIFPWWLGLNYLPVLSTVVIMHPRYHPHVSSESEFAVGQCSTVNSVRTSSVTLNRPFEVHIHAW